MKQTILILFFLALFPQNAFPEIEPESKQLPFEENQIYYVNSSLDSNIAFFEGKEISFLIPPPSGFKLEIERAKSEGYSMAFILEDFSYDSSEVRIDISIFSFKKKNRFGLKKYIANDSTALKEHFGINLEFYKIDSILNNSNERLATYYINNKSKFIPNVMVAYYFRTHELLIFELSISESYPRFKAEKQFLKLVQNFKTISMKEISSRD